MKERLILFYNTMFGEPLDVPGDIPVGFTLTVDRQFFTHADAVVFHLPEWKNGRRYFMPRKMPGQIWVAWSMECEENYRMLQNSSFMRRFDITMAYRLQSDVPVPYVDGSLRRALRQPVRSKLPHVPVVAFVSSGFNQSGRQQYIRELARWIPLDSYGKFMQNKILAKDQGISSKIETISQYKFTVAFENACGMDYVTEKFYQPLCGGSVPIYMGAPNIQEFAPGRHCFIDVRDFPQPKALAEYLILLANDNVAYHAYLDWKDHPYLDTFERLLMLTEKHPFIRLCERVQALLNHRAKESS